ncbi:hypothetical protein HHK36_028387 [Tetracentron sinense]|uniref:Uncharacterized protein n=1 Tax=Tetracentron sinense TaxID=13715 RepID=A0A834YFM4_TETSI|nr:hypothetical protein HHK36_031985 [Tetracentron sinense]KAF8378962.1 hypothetical protein HHK36_028387 [Tetracentron sinense]
MATNLQSRGFATFGKRFANQISIGRFRDPAQVPRPSISSIRRGSNTPVYEKNLDDQLRPSLVQEDVIQPHSDKYWAPHPETGVFGPITEKTSTAGRETFNSPPANGAGAGAGSSLEQKAWFRPLEDVEKPYQP